MDMDTSLYKYSEQKCPLPLPQVYYYNHVERTESEKGARAFVYYFCATRGRVAVLSLNQSKNGRMICS
uniref:Uncharacterized protein n=1 Tax=Sphaerodactylus townsendi TaxID=933632 RepID=A0ACB8ERN9_9SAUR